MSRQLLLPTFASPSRLKDHHDLDVRLVGGRISEIVGTYYVVSPVGIEPYKRHL